MIETVFTLLTDENQRSTTNVQEQLSSELSAGFDWFSVDES